jgi:hypothetical protein
VIVGGALYGNRGGQLPGREAGSEAAALGTGALTDVSASEHTG